MREPDAVNRRTLHGIAVLDELGTAERVSLERECIWRRYREGERLFERGSSSNEVFFIVEGSVRIVSSSATGRDVSFARAGAGEVIGEMAAIDGLPRSASVSAAEELAGGRVTRHAVCGPRQTEWRNCGQASASAVRHGAPHRGARRRIVESRCHEAEFTLSFCSWRSRISRVPTSGLSTHCRHFANSQQAPAPRVNWSTVH